MCLTHFNSTLIKYVDAEVQMTIKKGIYKHYKGPFYEVLEVARHSETEEELVIYRCLYGDYSIWARPLTMFEETICHEGQEIKRFQLQEKGQKTRLPFEGKS